MGALATDEGEQLTTEQATHAVTMTAAYNAWVEMDTEERRSALDATTTWNPEQHGHELDQRKRAVLKVAGLTVLHGDDAPQ